MTNNNTNGAIDTIRTTQHSILQHSELFSKSFSHFYSLNNSFSHKQFIFTDHFLFSSAIINSFWEKESKKLPIIQFYRRNWPNISQFPQHSLIFLFLFAIIDACGGPELSCFAIPRVWSSIIRCRNRSIFFLCPLFGSDLATFSSFRTATGLDLSLYACSPLDLPPFGSGSVASLPRPPLGGNLEAHMLS